MSQQDVHPHVALMTEIHPDWQIQRVLGEGSEGVVYLVKDRLARKFVAKIFYEATSQPDSSSLYLYAGDVSGDCVGLPQIELLEFREKVIGVAYEYRPLYRIHHRFWRMSDHLAQVQVGTFCRFQAYLMSTRAIALLDPHIANFLLAPDGRFHWVDIGVLSIASIDHADTIAKGKLGFGFTTLLLSVHGINIFDSDLPTTDYSYAQQCLYIMDPRLDILAEKHHWLRDLLAEVRQQKASLFLEPEFYSRLSTRFPERVQMPRALISASWLLSKAGYLRNTHRRKRSGKIIPQI